MMTHHRHTTTHSHIRHERRSRILEEHSRHGEPQMTSFHATLNLTFDARDEEQALEIAQACRQVILAFQGTNLHAVQPYKVAVDIDDVEEN